MLAVLVAVGLAAACVTGGRGVASGSGSAFLEGVSWDAEYDVVVIGFGGAGSAAAITAADAGARVLLLEKAPMGEEGGNTRYPYGATQKIGNREQGITYYKALRGKFDHLSDEMIEFFVDNSMTIDDWIIGLGADEAKTKGSRRGGRPEYPEFPGGESIGSFTVDGEAWTGSYWKLLRKNIMARSDKIHIWYSSPAVQLIQDKDTRIIHGVKAENRGKTYNIRAINGVVMAMGGFACNDEMLENYTRLADAYSKGARYNTGDGVKMAIDVGADLWNMSTLSGPDVNFVIPETGIAAGYYYTLAEPFHPFTGFTSNNVINVGGDGTRFMNEAEAPRHGYVETSGTWFPLQVPHGSWCVFDDTARRITPPYLSWSPDLSEEIARGWVIKANTIRELAEKMGMDSVALTKTVTDFNRYCAQGNDPDFHVDPKYLKPIATAPFYAFPIKATILNTQGGARRNAKCEVMDVWGEPIPHLYSAGEFGCFIPDVYQAGGDLAETAITGREAGKNAALPKNDVPRASVMRNKTPADLRTPLPVFPAGPNEYIGTAMGISNEIIVKVTLGSAQKITDIAFLWIHETRGISDRAIVQVPQAIIRAQSTNVDTVTGATVTSKAIINAVNDALSKAK
ncbi:MAG: FAD-binding protein [Treponema sp.]|nr:FAD-binding protein [Treponema sp.]